jgi:acyl-Coa thioesterase superfamily protein/acyl-CoA thioesterase superfamily protein
MPATMSHAKDALFRIDGEELVATELARGPWDPNALHGGPTAALLARALERHDPGPATFVARLTVELLRPVPIAPLRVVARTARPGRNVQTLDGVVLAGDVEVARASALRLRTTELVLPDTNPVAAMPPPRADAPPVFPDLGVVGYWTANDLQFVEGNWAEPGPGSAWTRLRTAVVEGEEPSPLQRVAAAADFGSGIGNPVRATDVGAINPDLTIHVHRDLRGEWVGLQSRAWAHPAGVGMAETLLFDGDGTVGRAVQSLLVQPHRRPIGADLPRTR